MHPQERVGESWKGVSQLEGTVYEKAQLGELPDPRNHKGKYS